MTILTAAALERFLAEVRASNLTPESKAIAEQLAANDAELRAEASAVRTQLAALRQKQSNETLNQPSSKKPEWDKAGDDEEPGKAGKPGKPKRKRKLGGRRKGAGNRPKTHLKPDRQVHNLLEQCPDCATSLAHQPELQPNTRIVEDIEPPAEKTLVTQETSARKWCPPCKKIVSAKSALALPGSDIGLHATVRIVYLWVVTALSLPNIAAYLARFMQLGISTSGIANLVIRVADILKPVTEEILHDVCGGFQVWADETGWRVRGVTWWLWAFANKTSAYYCASPSRGSPVVVQI